MLGFMLQPNLRMLKRDRTLERPRLFSTLERENDKKKTYADGMDKMQLPDYKPHKDRRKRIESAVIAIKTLVPLKLENAHINELISVCIWKITEADGKYKNNRYQSETYINSSKTDKNRIHEHVFERKKLTQEIINNPNKIDQIIKEMAIACVVTKDEHDQLTKVSRENPDLEGWKRYKKAGIKAYDLLDRKLVTQG